LTNSTASSISNLAISSPSQEGTFQASKWLHWQALLDEEEMIALCNHLSPFSIHIVSTLVERPHGYVSVEQFLDQYKVYITSLKQNREPDEKRCRPFFSSVFTRDQNALYAMEAGEKYLIKPRIPVIQLQLHHVFHSSVDGKFYPKVHGTNSISWGIQFSYPQIFQDPITREIVKVDNSSRFPNTELFTELSRWLRSHTLPTPFVVREQRMNQPIRLGKQCWRWIAQHPQLSSKGIHVATLPSVEGSIAPSIVDGDKVSKEPL
jgi:hypothetical protein